MAILDSSSSAVFVNDVNTVTWNHTVGAGSKRFMDIEVGWVSAIASNCSISSVKFNGVSATAQATKIIPTDDAHDYGGAIYGLIAPDVGTYLVEVIMVGIPQGLTGGATSWTDVDQVIPVGTAVANSGTIGFASLSITSTAGQVVVGLYSGYRSQGPNGAGHVQRWDQHDPMTGHHANGTYKLDPVTSLEWTPNQGYYWTTCAITINASSSISVGTAAGVGAASGFGRSSIPSVGTAAGLGSASGIFQTLGASVGTASGLGTANAIGPGSTAASGVAAGLGDAAGVGRAKWAVIANAMGMGGASGVGSSSGQVVKAFPSAEGYAETATGGRGGTVYFVDNLNDSGPGSLRAGLTAVGTRMIIVRVSGTCQIASTINITSPNFTFAGQTSPGGFQVRGPNNGTPSGISLSSGSGNAIIRDLRDRTGGPCPDDQGESLLAYGTTTLIDKVIFDHCSVEWGTDAQMMYYNNVTNGTFQWCIIAEGGNNSTFGPLSGTGKGMHILAGSFNCHHNLSACNTQRNPYVQSASFYDQRNELVYGWEGNNAAQYGSLPGNSAVRGNVIGNYYIYGPESGRPYYLVENGAYGTLNVNGQATNGTKLFTSGNWGPDRPSGPSSDLDDFGQFYTTDFYPTDGSIRQCDPNIYRLSAAIVLPYTIATDAAPVAKTRVLANAGANKPFRDSADQHVIDNVNNLTGGTSRTVAYENGNWPDLATGAPTAPLDSDNDGIPNAWAIAHGLDPLGSPGPNISSNGYSFLENYLNELMGDTVPPWGSTDTGDSSIDTLFRASTTATAASGTAVTITAPSTNVGDLTIIVIAANGDNPNQIADNNGATPFHADVLNYNAEGSVCLALYTRRFQAGDPSTYRFTLQDSDRWTAHAIALQNPHPTITFDVVPSLFATGAPTTTGHINTITTTSLNAIHFTVLTNDSPSNTITSTPAGYTVRQNGGTQALAVCTKVISFPGATGDQICLWGVATGYESISFAIRDADRTINSGTGTAAGIAGAAGVGRSVVRASGSAVASGAAIGHTGLDQGTGTASGIGAAFAVSATVSMGTAAGLGSASGVTAVTTAGVGSAAGTGSAAAIGASTTGSQAIGSAQGVGSATAISAQSNASVGTAAGVGSATALSLSGSSSMGIAAGSSTAMARGRSSADVPVVPGVEVFALTSITVEIELV